MKVVLLRDCFVEDRFGVKTIRTTVRFSRGLAFEWRTGTVIEVSEATGAKMIAAGDAAKVEPVTAEAG